FFTTGIAVTTGTYYLLKRKQAASQAPFRDALTIFVTLHTLYIIYVITLQAPPNLFRTLNLPLNAHPDKIRSTILQKAGLPSNATLPKHMENLLTRLSSFDGRSVYVRFGQSVIQDCDYCRRMEQYAMYAIPRPLLQYIREAIVIGLVTTRDSHHGDWRVTAVGMLAIAALLEASQLMSAQIIIPKNGKVFFWADNCWLARQLLFLILPIWIHCSATHAPITAVALMEQTRALVERASRRSSVLRYIHGAVMREPALRASASQWWSKQRTVGQWAREDETVRNTAEKLGCGF
ncbi:hypothetical protein BDY19DRAFT_855738, partial [Irpex rosettiformis]